jgi:hypothetical protein
METLRDEEMATAATWFWHHDPRWGYQFLYPEGWHRFTFSDGREGVLYAPSATDWTTNFSVEIRDLGVEVTGEDLPDLEAGFREGLRSLPDCQIAWLLHWRTEPPIILEAKYTFREGTVTRQRRSRLVYVGTRQFHVLVQGATPADFEEWRPLLYVMLMSFNASPESPARKEPPRAAHKLDPTSTAKG